MFLNDQETATDLLYYEAIAKTVVTLIRKTPDAPVTIGVHGDWGAGKSSVLKMLEGAFAEDDRVLCLWFNGWTFEGFEDAKTVVIETIVDELRRARPTSTKVADAAKKVLKRVDWLKLARKAGGFAFTATTGIPTFDQVKGLYDVATSFLAKPQDHVSIEDLKGVAEKAGEFLKEAPDESDNLPEHIHAFREEFKELLDAADIDQLVVIIDDLDRCLPKTAIATLEAIRLFLFVERTAFVIGADELMIEYAVREHFPDLPPSSGPVSYARNYLEKLIQVPFRIPALGVAETRVYVTLLLAENALGSKDPRFLNLLASAREDMRRPWKSRGLDRRTVEQAMAGKMPPDVDQALVISAHVTKILSEGTRGNPRQIKRFLNSMMLRHAIAEERGFGADIQRPVLAKIMLAERFYPDFYEQIARLAANHPDGQPEALRRFEEHVRAPAPEEDDDEKPAAKGGRKAARSAPAPLPAEAMEWEKNEWAKGWAAIDPPLTGVDLRPYVFVTRDKRSSLGGLAAASHLEGLVEKLMGPTMMVRGAVGEIAKLTGPEPEEVFEAIRGRILQDDNFAAKPKGADGLVRLVEAHPALQRRLLEFIRELPVAKVGSWAASSWGACFTDTGIAAEYQTTLRSWAEQTENSILQKAAQGISKLQRG
ncbi:putative KAP-like P-loop ATPase [Novosphingobium sp. SG751A]|uniref:NTPase KAP n=1 Tax=Pseudoroseomonas ludipueritiae TaxID=198093 RepID=A0ABR7R4W0_9PROT|nr:MULTISPECIES: Qat anti-phage system ATPase QatA [Alphaproteobacteria]MBC9176714.1 NTPase KAP [Pseudoroseomonas ludipueritiae]NOW44762.1 putative KAP-like P-loop ATPase [Novosphingobium sp. SG751A]